MYLTAVINAQCVTVSGPPEAIADFEANHLLATASASQPAHIYALYHSPVLRTTKERVLADIRRRGVRFPDYEDLKCSLRSTFDGSAISSQSHPPGSTLVEDIIDMILVHPVRFDVVIERVRADLLAEGSESVCLVNVGPGTGLWRSTMRMLRDGGLSVEGVDWSSSSVPAAGPGEGPTSLPQEYPAPQATAVPGTASVQHTNVTPERRSQMESIAIVGMAVNFPGAPNAAEFWKVLKEGINTMSEVRMVEL